MRPLPRWRPSNERHAGPPQASSHRSAEHQGHPMSLAPPREEAGTAGRQAEVPFFRLQGKVALVTGAAALLGSAITRAFVQAGAQVLAVDIDTVRGEALQAELGPLCRFVPCDITSDAA